MAALHLKHRTQEDFSLSFAIHTVFTLGNHRAIWQQKRKAVQEREKAIRNKDATPGELLVLTMRLSVLTCRIHIGFQR